MEPDTGQPSRAGARAWAGLIASIAIAVLVELIAARLTAASVSTWYPGLAKPCWTPPGWLFGPVWTALYLSMAVAAWLVWKKGGFAGARAPLALYTAQLILNAAWSGIFFALRMPGPAFGEIVLLWIAVLSTLVSFLRVSRAAGILLVPYLLWVTFAAALNFSIWRLNP